MRRSTRRMVTRYLERGVAPSGTVEEETHGEVFVRRGDTETLIARDSITTFTRFLELSPSEHPDPNSVVGNQLFYKILNSFFRPTLVPNEAETERRRDEARALVEAIKDHVRANERIINNHEIVTAQARDRLLALQQELLDRGGLNGGNIRSVVGQVLTNGLVLAVFWVLSLPARGLTFPPLGGIE